MIRFTPSNHATLAPGNVLLSEPFLDDPYFGRKVVLLCEHNEEGLRVCAEQLRGH